MKKICYLLTVFFILTPCFLAAQNNKLLNSRKTSRHTYIYRITKKEAEKVNKKGVQKIDSTYFHTLVHSYPTDSIFTEKLPSGHYLKTFSEKNKQQIFYTYVADFDVFVLNNNTDLSVQVYDLKGKLIRDARVKIGARNLKFDTRTHCYVLRKSYKRKGVLEVSYRNKTAYFQLTGTQRHSRFGLEMRKLLYVSPVKYLWKPIDLAARVPGDAINSIRNQWAQGTIADISRFFKKLFNPSEYEDDDLGYKGYMVFNKPKYLPGDTVKFKAFAVSKKGKPLDKKVNVALYNYKKWIQLTELKPYRPGAFEYQFFLHDSLDLTLDKSYSVYLDNTDGDTYINSSFHYEDYELNHTKLTLNTPTDNHYKEQKFKLFAKGTDDNELNLMDARLEITATTKNIENYVTDAVFVPDTLWTHKMDLEPTGETEIIVPDDSFPEANVHYNLEVRMLTSDNKTFTEQKQIAYYFQKESFELNVVNDSINIIFRKNGVEIPKNAQVVATDNFGNRTTIGNGITPYKIPINVYYNTYTAQNGDTKATLNMSSESSLLQCFSSRTSDSLFIEIENPRKLNFTYNIYERNREKFRGYSESLAIKNRTNSYDNYYLSIRYLWGGKIVDENYRIPFFDKKLNIAVKQPTLVYPGQKSNIEVTVTDQKGKPVGNVDVTAYSMTKKFDYQPPTLPYLGKNMPEKKLINNFTIKSNDDAQTSRQLNYAAWKVLANIDSIEYYKFLYPQHDIYSFAYRTEEYITQFAPFVVSNGQTQPIFAIYVNDVPVYFDWTNTNQPYSFKVEPYKRHRIKIRLSDRSITLNNITFKKGYKTILSIPSNLQNKDVTVVKEKKKLSEYEKSTLYKYTFPYRNSFQGNLAYIKNRDNYFLLSPATNSYNRHFIGPIAGQVEFELLNDYKHTFNHEPYFEYDFAPNTIKMREIKSTDFPLSNNLYSLKNLENNLSDTVLTKKIIQKEMQAMIERKRQNQIRYNFPNRTTGGNGTLIAERIYENNKISKIPLNTLILKSDDEQFIRVYPGAANSFYDLKQGIYKLITFYTGSYYHIADSISVKANGINFARIHIVPENLKKDAFSLKVNALIEENILKNTSGEYSKNQELNQIFSTYRSENVYTGEGQILQGRITEEDSGEPIIGATIVVKGTNYGAISDMDGFYSLKVPKDKYLLDVLYVGFEPYEIDTRRTFSGDVVLKPDVQMLDEVVVVGYGVQSKKSLTGAVVSVNTTGMFETALQGKVPGIMIRGLSSIDATNSPLIIIDGKIYTGDISNFDINSIGEMTILKPEEATSIYGARAANGVILISSSGNKLKDLLDKDGKGAEFDENFLLASSETGSIRNNFSDYAFWQPKLTTDKNGKASFNVVFPDDVTNWNTYVLAMNGNRQSGQSSGNIKSYKPIMGQLSVPNFLLPGDTSVIIGKSLNYMPDSMYVTTSFDIDGKKVFSKQRMLANSIIDTVSLIATADTATVQYSLEKTDGYFDGEERKIPVFPIGLEETVGNFYILEKDTTASPTFDTTMGEVTLYADASYLDVLSFETNRLIGYRYDCNEQLASKLIGMLSHRLIAQHKGEKLKYERDIKKVIEKLLQNRNRDGLWGWWKESGTNFAFSSHILNSFDMASKQGFNVSLDKKQTISELMFGLESNRYKNAENAILILKSLYLMDPTLLLSKYIQQVDSIKNKSLNDELNLLQIKQITGIPFTLDKLKENQQTTMFGNIFYRDEKNEQTLTNSDIQNTLIAYRILKNMRGNDNTLSKIRLYLLETKQNNRWWNTYESAQILETILSDMLKISSLTEKTSLAISGSINKTIDTFPAAVKLSPTDNISISKRGFAPVYLTTYQKMWNQNPQAKKEDFEIITYFENKPLHLTQGEKLKMIVELDVKKDADFVMLNVPIPAGCSYGTKRQYRIIEIHREYFKNEITIFCEKLKKGKYTFEIELIPRFSGNYTLNPAKVELMYFPTFNANNEIKKVEID
ncbi:MAG: carboxypeptidase-like regulatory domain-containing protein [Bacteroidia bacterium]|nr:carboxypeptidase-like regulatory domain-containing protein [Bacteroidia bacterium]